jgi:hypothetical protein
METKTDRTQSTASAPTNPNLTTTKSYRIQVFHTITATQPSPNAQSVIPVKKFLAFPRRWLLSRSFPENMEVVAQLVELQIVVLAVAGSSPVDLPIFPFASWVGYPVLGMAA